MDKSFYENLARQALAGKPLSEKDALTILVEPQLELISLVQAAYQVRKKFAGDTITIHILNNVQNGYCPEDCTYCAQSKHSKSPIQTYPMKTDQEILSEAEEAFRKGAFRYCMVFSGKRPTRGRIVHLAKIVKKIKASFPIEVCVSAGSISEDQAVLLKEAGLDRLNHNINTSENNYHKICTTHSFTDRINTLKAAQAVDLQICSGVIIGMGETPADIYQMADTLRTFNVDSVPVNFFIPVPGVPLKHKPQISPEYCLRVLSIFRFHHPQAEIRVAAGRELYLRSLEPLAFFIANSLFMEGYLNVRGATRRKTLEMLQDAGFTIKSEFSLEEIIQREENIYATETEADQDSIALKNGLDLRPNKS